MNFELREMNFELREMNFKLREMHFELRKLFPAAIMTPQGHYSSGRNNGRLFYRWKGKLTKRTSRKLGIESLKL